MSVGFCCWPLMLVLVISVDIGYWCLPFVLVLVLVLVIEVSVGVVFWVKHINL